MGSAPPRPPGWRGGNCPLRTAHCPLVLALTLLAFGLRVWGLNAQSLWRDEVDAWYFATRELTTVVGNLTRLGENGPLYFLLLRGWIELAGGSPFVLRFFSLLFGVLAVPLTYAVGRHLADQRVGRYAALLVAIGPFWVWYAQEAKMYALVAFLSLLSLLLLVRALFPSAAPPPSRWAAYVVITSLTLYVHVFAVFLIAFQGVLGLAVMARRWQIDRGWAVSYGLLTVPYLPLAVWQLPAFASAPPTGFPFVGPAEIVRLLFFAFSLNSAPANTPVAVAGFTFVLLAGLLLHRRWPVPLLIGYLMLPLLAFYLVSLRVPLFTERYFSIVLPGYVLLLGCGLAAIQARSRLAAVLAALLLVASSLAAVWVQTTTPIKADFRAAAQRYAERVQGSPAGEPVMFLMGYNERAFRYYYRGPIEVLPAPYTNDGLASEAIAAQLRATLDGRRAVWLVLAEAGMQDSRALVPTWLASAGRLDESHELAGITLRRYSF